MAISATFLVGMRLEGTLEMFLVSSVFQALIDGKKWGEIDIALSDPGGNGKGNSIPYHDAMVSF